MSDTKPSIHSNVYQKSIVGAPPNPFMPNPDAIDEAFIEEANCVLNTAVELIRVLIGAHQSAIAIIVKRDWQAVHKFFSLSEKYASWADYRTAAQGVSIHAWMLENNQPMRVWLDAPSIDRKCSYWGLLLLSDKYDGAFTAEDEKQFVAFAGLVSAYLEALRDLRNSYMQQQTIR
jgi:hypothetical protein